jgi:hypothetical protein
MESSNRKTWLSILIAAVIVVGMIALTIVGGTAYFFFHHINATFTAQENAEQQFADARARFAGRRPLIEIRHEDDEPIVHRELVEASHSTTRLETLRVLAYDVHAEKLVRVSIPFWLIRLAPGKHFSFRDNGFDFDSDRVRLSYEDLERLGPGLILDTQDRRGSHVLVWTE